jgi:UDP-N-acetylmuramyl pentapeptide phosphotransferase/UDP-N-acetylglucosamine-1-phosphate transferase
MLSLLVWFYDLNLFAEEIWLFLVFVLIGCKCLSIMDGINGITVLYALTAIISFGFITLHQDSLSANYNGTVLCSFEHLMPKKQNICWR